MNRDFRKKNLALPWLNLEVNKRVLRYNVALPFLTFFNKEFTGHLGPLPQQRFASTGLYLLPVPPHSIFQVLSDP